MMNAIESQPSLLYAQPTSGLRRWIGNVVVTVLTPSIQLRNRFDTYGVEVNNSSIALRIEFPATRVVQRAADRSLVDTPNTKSLILGGDAQTLSWSYADTDFPVLAASSTAAAKAIKAATGSDPLRSQVLKVSHHASKHGVNLELVERIDPALTLVSSVAGGGAYRFPHTVTQELIREAIDPTTTSGDPHPPDWELGIFYTSDTTDSGTTAWLVRRRDRAEQADGVADARHDDGRDRPRERPALDRLTRRLSGRAATTRRCPTGFRHALLCVGPVGPVPSLNVTSPSRTKRSSPHVPAKVVHAGLVDVRRTSRGATMRRPPPAWSTSR